VPVPDYQTLMLPLLVVAGDANEHSMNEVVDRLAEEFRLAVGDRRELLPSGRQPTLDNRVGWACTYLKKAGLLESAGRGRFRITTRGIEVLKKKPDRIDNDFLSQFQEFLDFRRTSQLPTDIPPDSTRPPRTGTPEEILEAEYQRLQNTLAQEVLGRLKATHPAKFERIVLEVLLKLGYGGSRQDVEAVGRSGDGGIDGIIKEDRLGLDVLYVQAKRWKDTVGSGVVRDFTGALEGHRARKGILITTSQFAPDAKRFVEKIEKRVVLMDGDTLASLMIEHGVGVSEVARYVVQKIDSDYFEDDA